MTVEFNAVPDSGDMLEVIYEGAHIAGIEPGGQDAQNNYKSELPGFTVSYGRGFESSKWFATLDAAKAWSERKADDLLDY